VTEPLTVLYEDNHLLAVNKPAGLLTMGDDTGDETVVDLVRNYLREKYNKPGNVYVGVVHRLDRPVSGVLLLARTSKAAGRLSNQFRAGTVQKTYHAIVEKAPDDPEATLTDWLLKDSATNTVRCVTSKTDRAKKAVLDYRLLGNEESGTRLEIRPKTGRSHQIRVQLSSREMPIVGDVKYGASRGLGHRILLHAVALDLEHPVRKEPLRVECAAEFDLCG